MIEERRNLTVRMPVFEIAMVIAAIAVACWLSHYI